MAAKISILSGWIGILVTIRRTEIISLNRRDQDQRALWLLKSQFCHRLGLLAQHHARLLEVFLSKSSLTIKKSSSLRTAKEEIFLLLSGASTEAQVLQKEAEKLFILSKNWSAETAIETYTRLFSPKEVSSEMSRFAF
eukprot:GHVP01063181.1.p1 GENE.GHVP01063181.1~~GHVP01063181.1.p1  ORF type:complete len:138 (-),score=22.13 GHVP01063181.1:27-440(-)